VEIVLELTGGSEWRKWKTTKGNRTSRCNV